MRSNVADEEFIELPHRGLELLLQDHGYRVQEIELSRIQNFPNHPYPVREGRDMDELVESIRKMGQLESALLRELSPDSYQLLSGHRRKMALSLLGQNTMRAVIIPDLTDRQAEGTLDEATVKHLLGVDRGDEPSGGRTPPLTMRAIRAFFPATMTKEQIDEELRRLLSAWQSGQK